IILQVTGNYKDKIQLHWKQVDLQTRQTWQNLNESVEDAAYGLSIITIWNFTPYKVLKQSFKGSGFDYLAR
ncbi:MAG: hypothetical protein AAGJ18_26440, partial [Bacteroidota bacterium]